MGFEFAWQAVDDVSVAAKMQELAPDAPPGSQEAIDAFEQAKAGLDFDSSDGIDGQNTYADKGLNYLEGGRKQLLEDQLEVAGKDPQEASEIATRHFFKQMRDNGYDDAGQYGHLSWGDRIKLFRAEFEGTAGPPRVAQ